MYNVENLKRKGKTYTLPRQRLSLGFSNDMCNDNKKLPILEEIKSFNPKLSNFNKKQSKNSADFLDSNRTPDNSLGNREIRCHYENVRKKYYRKQVAQYALTVGNTSDNLLHKRHQKNTLSKAEFKLKRKNDEAIKTINKSLCSCGRDLHYKNEEKIVDIKETDTTRRIKGLKSCGNNAACPVCAAKLSTIRGNQLSELMEAGRKNNRSYILAVTTIPHQPLEVLDITQNQVIDMSRYIFQHKQFREFKKITKCRFIHGGLENMISFKNGLIDWHPHKNYILDFDIPIKEVISILGLNNEAELSMYISQLMTSLGQKYLDSKKIDKQLLKPYYQSGDNGRIIVKGGVSATIDFQDNYIAKWGLEAEMTASIYKDGRIDGSMHPFGLLDLISDENKETTKEQKYQCIKAFQEFVLASKGKWWFYFARGSIAYYNEHYGTELKVRKDEEELELLEDKGDLVYSLSEEEWKMFEPTPRKIGFALSLPTRKEVIEFIYDEIERNRIKIVEKYNCRISTYLRQRKKE